MSKPTSIKKRWRPPEPDPDTTPLTLDEWRDAVCAQVDTEIFFAEQGEGYHDAQVVCSGCPIAARCLAANLEEDYGFYASSPPHRRRLRRAMAKAAAVTTDETWTAQEEAS